MNGWFEWVFILQPVRPSLLQVNFQSLNRLRGHKGHADILYLLMLSISKKADRIEPTVQDILLLQTLTMVLLVDFVSLLLQWYEKLLLFLGRQNTVKLIRANLKMNAHHAENLRKYWEKYCREETLLTDYFWLFIVCYGVAYWAHQHQVTWTDQTQW